MPRSMRVRKVLSVSPYLFHATLPFLFPTLLLFRERNNLETFKIEDDSGQGQLLDLEKEQRRYNLSLLLLGFSYYVLIPRRRSRRASLREWKYLERACRANRIERISSFQISVFTSETTTESVSVVIEQPPFLHFHLRSIISPRYGAPHPRAKYQNEISRVTFSSSKPVQNLVRTKKKKKKKKKKASHLIFACGTSNFIDLQCLEGPKDATRASGSPTSRNRGKIGGQDPPLSPPGLSQEFSRA
ncbi:hypothetical protein V1478_011327 [Vespula squamosa]|uniref:Uncharacterized protein n=1 Tax=Vespula squamosa TaxID=30214 RepID=A0ABD2AE62_VESSQ